MYFDNVSNIEPYESIIEEPYPPNPPYIAAPIRIAAQRMIARSREEQVEGWMAEIESATLESSQDRFVERTGLPVEMYGPAGDALGGEKIIDASLQAGRYPNPLEPDNGAVKCTAHDSGKFSWIVDADSKMFLYAAETRGKKLIVQSGSLRVLAPPVNDILAIQGDYVTVETDDGVKILAAEDALPPQDGYVTRSQMYSSSDGRRPVFAKPSTRRLERDSWIRVFDAQMNGKPGFLNNYDGEDIVVHNFDETTPMGTTAPVYMRPDLSGETDDFGMTAAPLDVEHDFDLTRPTELHPHVLAANALYQRTLGQFKRYAVSHPDVKEQLKTDGLLNVNLPPVPITDESVAQLALVQDVTGEYKLALRGMGLDGMPSDSGLYLVRGQDRNTMLVGDGDDQTAPVDETTYLHQLSDAGKIMQAYFDTLDRIEAHEGYVPPTSELVPRSAELEAAASDDGWFTRNVIKPYGEVYKHLRYRALRPGKRLDVRGDGPSRTEENGVLGFDGYPYLGGEEDIY